MTPLAVRRPQCRRSPPISATSRPSTYSRVTPYLKARGPPALVAALPPNRAHLERRRVGRVEQPDLLDRGLHLAGDDPGLDHADQIVGIDLDDPLHLLGRQDDAAGDGQGAADQAAAGAARGHRHLRLGADPQDRRDLVGGLAQRRAVGRVLAAERALVPAVVDQAIVATRDHLGGAQLAGEQVSDVGHASSVAAAAPASPPSQTLNDDPQPQVDLTFGLLNLKPAPCRPST